jgi:crossover junction endodeoxyribonuclease RuvC
MVKRLLNLPGLPGPDAADALGLAITHAHARHSALAHQLGAAATKPEPAGQVRAGRVAHRQS